VQRLRLLAADLVVFDRHRLGWRLAARTLIVFLLPLLAAQVFGLPFLVYMALGGFLVSIGDSIDDGDREQFARIALGAVAGGLAVACGVVAGSSLTLALAGALLWGVFTGLLGLYGSAFATMGLPIAWAYVEVGLPADRHDLRLAVLAGALWAAGGGLVALLTHLTPIGGADAALGERCAACYRALAEYFDALRHKDSAVISPETRLRAAIAEARRLAENSHPATSDRRRQQLALIDTADRLFSAAAPLRTRDVAPRALEALADVSREIATAVSGARAAAPIDVLLARMNEVGASVPEVSSELTAAPAPRPWRAAVRPLRDGLTWQSVIARHALRFALVLCVAVGVFWIIPPPFGFWVPLTVTVVLKPYAGATLARAVQRVVGTVGGILLASALLPLLPGMELKIAFVAAAFFCLMLVLPFNYSLAIFFLSLGVVPFEHVLMPSLALDVGAWRLGATMIGAALGLIGGHLLWPNFERRELPAMLKRSLQSAAGYAAAALTKTGLAEKRRAAGLDTTNFHMSAQRALSELGLSSHERDKIVVASASLQQLLLAANDIAHEARRLDAAAEAEKLLATLAEGKADGRAIADALRRLPPPFDKMGAEVGTVLRCQESWR
jgi:uncharacterized membrane protein YccC